jgi:hypothetical protein
LIRHQRHFAVLGHLHRHPWSAGGHDGCRRLGFHTSPHAPHRQYACSSGFREVVLIDDA